MPYLHVSVHLDNADGANARVDVINGSYGVWPCIRLSDCDLTAGSTGDLPAVLRELADRVELTMAEFRAGNGGVAERAA